MQSSIYNCFLLRHLFTSWLLSTNQELNLNHAEMYIHNFFMLAEHIQKFKHGKDLKVKKETIRQTDIQASRVL